MSEASEKNEFKKFLVGHAAFKKFCGNLKENNNMAFEDYMIVNKGNPEAIMGAFIWDDTLEDHDYWSSLNNKWRYRKLGDTIRSKKST